MTNGGKVEFPDLDHGRTLGNNKFKLTKGDSVKAAKTPKMVLNMFTC